MLQRGNADWTLQRPLFFRRSNATSKTNTQHSPNPDVPDCPHLKDAGAAGPRSHAGARERRQFQHKERSRCSVTENQLNHCPVRIYPFYCNDTPLSLAVSATCSAYISANPSCSPMPSITMATWNPFLIKTDFKLLGSSPAISFWA